MSTVIPLALAIFIGALGNVLLKVGTSKIPALTISLDTVAKIITNPALIIGILCMIGSFPFYTMAIQKLPLSVAVPLLSGATFVVVAIISAIFLKESLTIVNVIGIVIIIIGIVLAAYKM
jgi:small multidrug resistance pump